MKAVPLHAMEPYDYCLGSILSILTFAWLTFDDPGLINP